MLQQSRDACGGASTTEFLVQFFRSGLPALKLGLWSGLEYGRFCHSAGVIDCRWRISQETSWASWVELLVCLLVGIGNSLLGSWWVCHNVF